MRPQLSDYELLSSGKVRTLYHVDEDHILLVASDTISAFDFILRPVVPDKGRILTALTVFFLDYLGHKGIQHHLAGDIVDERIPAEVLGRALIVKQLKMVPVECVVRGYLTGSGLVEYQATGTVCGIKLPVGLQEASKLPEPIFTPAIKAELGEHDENVDFATIVRLHGAELAQQLREKSLDIYVRGAQLAAERNIILADTKCEFGWDKDQNLLLADEVLTPDSSRYWAAESYSPGEIQPSSDKQIVRNWLLYESGWDKNSADAPPDLPDVIVNMTREKYIEAYEKISGLSFADWP